MADIATNITMRGRLLASGIRIGWETANLLTSAPLAALAVVAIAAALKLTGIELQYVVGGFIVLFAQRLARKTLGQVRYVQPEPSFQVKRDIEPSVLDALR